MTLFLIGLAIGFIIGALLFIPPWRNERRQRLELEDMLGLPIKALIKGRRR